MSKISVIVILLLHAGRSFAQDYFVFIGSDNQQPFYVRVDSQFHSSSPEGHLILSQLKDSNYSITVGFPGQNQPEQHYSFSIDGKDQAFELRRQDPDGLRLYNLQNNQWLSFKGGGVAPGDVRSAGIKKDDAFSRMMAGVVHDTAVLYNTYAMERALSDSPVVITKPAPAQSATTSPATAQSGVTPPASPSTALIPTTTQSAPSDTANATAAVTRPPATLITPDTAAGKSADTVIAATGNPATSPANAAPPTATALATTRSSASIDTSAARPADVVAHQPAARFNDAAATAPGVTKLSEHHTTKNVRLVYADRSGSKKADTIDVVIPVDSPGTAKTTGQSPHTAAPSPHTADSNHIPATRAHSLNADSPIVSSGTVNRPTAPPAAPTETPRSHPADSSHKPGKTIAFINSDCHDFASDFDVDRLRIRMLEFSKDEERIAAARKEFKIRCYYTRQIRALSDLFTSNAAKFHFFEAAWPFAADEHFHELSDLLTDAAYNSKFKTMTHQQ